MKSVQLFIAVLLEFVIRVVLSQSVAVDLVLSSGKIFLEEKNIVNNTIHFPERLSKSVKIVLYPTLDIPDMVITKITQVKVGANLLVTGSTVPVMDWGIKKFQVPGRALSCMFELGDVMKIGRARTPEDESIMIQYEAIVPEQRLEGIGPGHNHQLGASVDSDGQTYQIGFRKAVFAYRSLPLLFKPHVKTWKSDKSRVTNVIQLMTQKKNKPVKNVFAF